MQVWRSLGVIVGLGVITGAGAHAASAASDPPLTVDEQTVAVTDGAAQVTVRNATGVQVTVAASVQLAPGYPFERTTPAEVAAGGATTIRVDVSGLDATKATRIVLVVAPTETLPAGWSTAIPVKIAVPAAAKPAVDTIEVTSRSVGDTRSFEVPLDNTGTCADVDLPVAAPQGAPPTSVVGYVSAGEHISPVTASCVARTGGQGLFAEVVVRGLAWDGLEYSGTIDLAPDDDDAGDLAVEVRRTMPLALFLALLALGLLLALFAHVWTSGVRAAVAQRLRVRALAERLTSTGADAPLVQFREIATSGGIADRVGPWDIDGALSADLASIDAALSGRTRWYRPADAKLIADLGKQLDEVETTISRLPALANELVRLAKVRGQLAGLTSFREEALAATLYRPAGEPVGREQLAAIGEAARNAIRVATAWPAALVTQTSDDIIWLRNVIPADGPRAPAFLDARTAAVDAWQTFVAQADNARTDEQINAAMNQLYVTRGAIAAARSALADSESVERGVLAAGAGEATTMEVAPPDQPVPPAPTPTRWLRARMAVTDRLLLAVVVVVALVGGLQALYVDKTIGGVWGCLAVVLWAFVSGTVAKPIAAAIARVADPSPTPAGQD